MKTLFCLLLIVGLASAQPIHGPYIVHASNSAIVDLETCVRGDTADVVWVESNHVLWQRFSLAFQTPIGELDTTLALNPWPRLELHDLTARNDSSWCCVVYQDEAIAYGMEGRNLTGFLSHGENAEYVHLDSSVSYYYISEGRRSGFSVRCNGELVTVMWLGEGWDPRMYFVGARGAVIDNENDILFHSGVGSVPIVSNMATRVFAWHSNEQFIRSLFTGSHYASLLSCYAVTGFVEACDFWADYNTRIVALIDFGLNTDSSGLAIYSEQNEYSNPRIASLIFDSVQFIIDTLGPIGLDDVSSSFFHPNYGFAALQILPNNLLLARIDTTGQAVQPVGVIYESGFGNNIADADVTITDDGKVVAVWSEVNDWNDGPRTLRIAWTDWHEFLDTPNEELPALPSEISLSSYPNPFNSTVAIQYDLPQAGHAELTAYDLQGRVVATLFDDFAPAGSAELHWSPENLASGVYFLNLEAPLANATHKILFLK